MVKVRTQALTKDFNPKSIVAVDTETTGLDVWGKSVPFMVSLADEAGNTKVLEWPVDPFTRQLNVSKVGKDVLYLRELLGNDKLIKVFHNSKFDIKMLEKVGIQVKGEINDTLFMARICFTLEMDYGLKGLALRRLGIPQQDEKDLHDAVNSARRKLKSHNIKAIEFNNSLTDDIAYSELQRYSYKPKELMLEAPEKEEDYWLPRYFDSENNLCARYAALDAYRTMGLYQFYKEIMDKDPYLLNKYNEEMRVIWPIVNQMEARGMKVFPEAIKEESEKCEKAMQIHLANMNNIIQELNLLPFPPEKIRPPENASPRTRKRWKAPEFNPSSPQQLLRILYLPESDGGLNLQTDRVSKKGNATTDKDTLRELVYCPFVKELVEYRAAKHTLGLFFKKFNILMKPDPLEKGSFCLHPGINQCGTKTGRASCSNPNLQQVSAGGKKSLSAQYNGQKVFGPRKGYVWLAFDYSQQEGRIFADLAQVPAMLNALETGTDLFEAMANEAWGGKDNPNALKAVVQALELRKTDWPEDQKVRNVWEQYNFSPHDLALLPSYKQDTLLGIISEGWLEEFNYDIVAAENSIGKTSARQRCKHITYAKMFGGSPRSYTHLLYCTLEEAKQFDEEYISRMPEMRQYMRGLSDQAKRDGYIITLYDQKLRVDPDFPYRAVSYMIQGSAAGQTKRAVARCDKFLKSTKLDAHMVIPIHDAIYFEVAKRDYSLPLVRAIKNRMEDTEGRIGVPMPVGVEIIDGRWGVDEVKIEV